VRLPPLLCHELGPKLPSILTEMLLLSSLLEFEALNTGIIATSTPLHHSPNLPHNQTNPRHHQLLLFHNHRISRLRNHVAIITPLITTPLPRHRASAKH